MIHLETTPSTEHQDRRCLLRVLEFAVIAAMIIIAVSCAAQSTNDFPSNPEPQSIESTHHYPAFSRQNWVNLAVVGGLSASDAISTPRAIANGNRELILPKNLAASQAGMIGLAVLRVSAQAWVTITLNRSGHQKMALWIERIHVGTLTPTLHNWTLPDQQRK